VFCNQDSHTINATFTGDPGTVIWYKDNVVIPNQTTASLTVTETGIYKCDIACGQTTKTDEVSITFNNIVADEKDNVSSCDSYTLPNDLSANNNYYTQTGGPAGTGVMLNAGDVISSSQTIYIFAQTGTTPNCTDESSFEVQIIPTPVLVAPANVVACDSFELPLLTVGNYFTGPGGTGLLLNAGDLISSTQTIFVYTTNGPCATEVSFVVTINSIQASTLPNVTVCDSYVLPTIEVGNFFTAPNGGGTQLAVSTAITTSQTIYIFAQTGTEPNCVSQTSFEVTVNATPPVDSLSDVTVCDSFELPTLTAGNYYTGPNGSGQALVAGNLITSSQTIYIFAQSNTVPNCTAENSFVVTIDFVSVDQLEDVEQCGSFILPTLSSNNVYFTGPNGSGTQLAAGSLITSTQTVYVYATSGTCSAGSSFEVVINNCVIPKGISPNGDDLNDVLDLSTFGVEKLSIFNRYGRKVYSRSNYTNQWGGQSDKGDELPDGTYYFVIEFETEPTKTGWIYINRER
jgi:gliding motility-associated-like protein